MNKDELENLKVRFGPDTATWPAPFRQEASLLLAAHRSAAISDEEKFDHLVLEAVAMPTDEPVITSKVMAKISRPKRQRFGWVADAGSWSVPATAAGMAFVVTLTAASGYWAGGTQMGISDDALLAFAVGIPPSEGAEPWIFTQEEGSRP
jgi:hypothetical protein